MALKDIFAGILKPIGDWAAAREERKSLESQQKAQIIIKEHELEMAKFDRMINLQSQGLTADMNWELEFAKQAASSWKDEYVLAVLSIPAILCFIPEDFREWEGGAHYVAEGFKALSLTPWWYQTLLCCVFAATFGIRWWRRQQSDT